MKNSKIIVPAMILGALVLGGVSYSANALAEDTAARRGPNTQALAEKLGVDQSKVDSAMNEIRAERQKERQTAVSSKLDEAVKDGVITAEQKQKILDKPDDDPRVKSFFMVITPRKVNWLLQATQ